MPQPALKPGKTLRHFRPFSYSRPHTFSENGLAKRAGAGGAVQSTQQTNVERVRGWCSVCTYPCTLQARDSVFGSLWRIPLRLTVVFRLHNANNCSAVRGGPVLTHNSQHHTPETVFWTPGIVVFRMQCQSPVEGFSLPNKIPTEIPKPAKKTKQLGGACIYRQRLVRHP